MITHKRDEHGNLVELSERERRQKNTAIGISEILQREIEDIEAGRSDGDTHELDEHGRRIIREPKAADSL